MNKSEFKENAKQSVDTIFAKIDELEQKKNQTKSELKDEYSSYISKLKAEKNDLKSQYESLLKTSDEKWDEAKASFEKSSESFKDGIQKVTSMLN